MTEEDLFREFSKENTVTWGTFNKKLFVLWDCPAGHSYPQSINGRNKGYKCTYCSGKRVLAGFNDLGTTHPHLVLEWHPTKNDISITETSKGSVKKFWWLGKECGHSWLMSPNSRTTGQNCAVCSGSQITEGNSIAYTHPDILKDWSENNSINYTSLSYGSKKKVLWICEQHGDYLATVQSKVNGHGCYICGKQLTGDARSTPNEGLSAEELFPQLLSLWDNTVESNILLSQVKPGSNKILSWKCPQGHRYTSAVHTQVSALKSPTLGCGQCWQASSQSGMEKDMQAYLEDLCVKAGLEIVFNNRKTIYPQELDVYVPEKKIAVEFNGLYWHSEEQGKDKWYHHNKWKACKDKGIQLIQVWEDDWVLRNDVVRSFLAHKLGLSLGKVYARATDVVEVDFVSATEFFDLYHVQGFVRAQKYLGLRDKTTGLLVAMMAVSLVKASNTVNLMRYATATHVVGGFTKLLGEVERVFSDADGVFTFSDNTVSDGGLYENSGFVAVGKLAPDYSYIMNKERKHKFGFRLKRFRNDPDLTWVEGLTEKELAYVNNLSRVWDAGKVKWLKTF